MELIVCLVVVLIALLILSIDFLPPLHCALVYNALSRTISSTTLTRPGLHLIGPFSSLRLVPATV